MRLISDESSDQAIENGEIVAESTVSVSSLILKSGIAGEVYQLTNLIHTNVYTNPTRFGKNTENRRFSAPQTDQVLNTIIHVHGAYTCC